MRPGRKETPDSSVEVRVGACTLNWAQAVCSPDQTARSTWQPRIRVIDQSKHGGRLRYVYAIFSHLHQRRQ